MRGDRRGIAYDERFGHKVRGRQLQRDYYTGALTIDPDGMHPQDVVVPPGPDGTGQPYAPGPLHGIPNNQIVGSDMIDDAFQVVPWPRMAFNPSASLVSENLNVTGAIGWDEGNIAWGEGVMQWL